MEYDLPAYDHEGSIVKLNIYHATQSRAIEAFNRAAILLGGGAYHVGVEVYGREWAYGRYADNKPCSGVNSVKPRANRHHQFHGTVLLQRTHRSKWQVHTIISELADLWKGCEYDLLDHNCIHFAQELVRHLGTGPLPPWIDCTCRSLSAVSGQINHVQGLINHALDAMGQPSIFLSKGSEHQNPLLKEPNGDSQKVAEVPACAISKSDIELHEDGTLPVVHRLDGFSSCSSPASFFNLDGRGDQLPYIPQAGSSNFLRIWRNETNSSHVNIERHTEPPPPPVKVDVHA